MTKQNTSTPSVSDSPLQQGNNVPLIEKGDRHGLPKDHDGVRVFVPRLILSHPTSDMESMIG
jgi:hypothetical protein